MTFYKSKPMFIDSSYRKANQREPKRKDQKTQSTLSFLPIQKQKAFRQSVLTASKQRKRQKSQNSKKRPKHKITRLSLISRMILRHSWGREDNQRLISRQAPHLCQIILEEEPQLFQKDSKAIINSIWLQLRGLITILKTKSTL